MVMRQSIIDIEKLLSPISPDKPTGIYLRYETEYDQISDAMSGEDPNLARGIWKRPLKKYEWVKAKELCINALTNKTKDLQLACWLTESIMHTNGFCGLADGLKLVNGLSKKFWNEIHPLPHEEDIETRLAPYDWLDEKFYVQIKLIPIAKAEVIADGYTFYTWERDVKKIHEEHEDEAQALEPYFSALVTSTENFHLELDQCIDDSLQTIKELREYLTSKVSNEAPAFSQLIQTLEDIKDLNRTAINYFASRKKTEKPEENTKESFETEEKKMRGAAAKFDFTKEELTNVDEAYESLDKISDYLIENEPEYPTGYMVKQAISFRYMDLKEFLNRRISNKNNLNKVLEILKLS